MHYPINRAAVFSYAQLGVVDTVVANINGAVEGVTNLPVTGATNANPIQITVFSTTGLSNGDYVTISGVIGNTNANGTWIISGVTGTTFNLNGAIGNAAYVSGGVVEGGDLGEVDAVIQANAVPDCIIAQTSSAVNFDVAIVAQVTVPQAYVPQYTSNVQTALALYFQTLPIGGQTGGAIQYNDIVGILYAAGVQLGGQSYVSSIGSLTLNGGTANLNYPSPTAVAVLSPTPNITVFGS
jgi:hypothetical protein